MFLKMGSLGTGSEVIFFWEGSAEPVPKNLLKNRGSGVFENRFRNRFWSLCKTKKEHNKYTKTN